MTCIVGIVDKENEVVYMATDSAAGDDSFIQPMNTSKIKMNGPYLIGYAGAPGTGQLIQYITLPTPPKKNLEKFMNTTFRNAVKKAYLDSAINVKEDDADILIGVNGELFFFNPSDFQMLSFDYTAIGSGSPIAMGSLHTTETWKSAEKRAIVAVGAAIAYSSTCMGPINVLWVQ